MATSKKPEIYFEVGTGFFRIPTSEANYNITVLGSGESSVTRVVEKIVEREKVKSAEDLPEKAVLSSSESPSAVGDDFYEHVSREMCRDMGNLARNLSSAIVGLQPDDLLGRMTELNQSTEKMELCLKQLQDIQGSSGNLEEFFSFLKNHPALSASGEVMEEDTPAAADESGEDVQGRLAEALALLSAMQDESGQAAPVEPEKVKEKKRRYLFDLDVVFQTLYELCTNETVKEHITSARERAAEIFVLDKFYDAIAPKAAKYEADSDNFFNVPMSDVFISLLKGCKDKGTANLLKKMDAGQASIFLDQTIPLEVPPTEEIEVEAESAAQPAPQSVVEPDARIEQVKNLVTEVKNSLAELSGKEPQFMPAASGGMTSEDKEHFLQKVEEAFAVVTTIQAAAGNAADSLTVPDFSAEQILEFFSRLSDCQMQLLGIVIACKSNLKNKSNDASLSLEDSMALAQATVADFLKKLAGQNKEGVLPDQVEVGKLLEEHV